MKLFHIAVVILNYNSEKDLQICAEQIAKQVDVHLSLIIVDNASQAESVKRIESWLLTWQPNAICRNKDIVEQKVTENSEKKEKIGQVYFVENDKNNGYSAGNNIGIRLADKLNADAVLIVNPDVRIEDTHYLAKLSQQLLSAPIHCIAASRIVGLEGEEQNPSREATFWEELLWPINYVKKFLGIKSKNLYIIPFLTEKPFTVPKVSGCCLMLSMGFLKTTQYLDENTFLYCEEPILSARVKKIGGDILFVPSLKATHAHVKSEKGDVSKRMIQFIKSRKYYLRNYSGYSKVSLWFLNLSYTFLQLFTVIRKVVSK